MYMEYYSHVYDWYPKMDTLNNAYNNYVLCNILTYVYDTVPSLSPPLDETSARMTACNPAHGNWQ